MAPFSTSPSQSLWTPAQHGVDFNGHVSQSFSPDGAIGDTSTDSKASRQRRGSSPGKRALNWFRSRSASPASVNHAEDGPPSPSSFVVRKVVKQPGGVSHLTDVHGSPVDASVHGTGYPYQAQKSRPISLGVPPGGPGGGTGYGTAKSSNDGRPETERKQQYEQPGDERGRSRSKSPNRPPSPGAITAGAFRGGRIAPGPLSSRQVAEKQEGLKEQKQKNRLSNPLSLRDQMSTSPLGPRSSPFSTTGQTGTSPRQETLLAGSMAGPAMSNVSAHANESPSRFSMPVHIPHGSGPPPVIPLEGIPSPVKIPLTPTRAGASPLGSASPAGSPGYFGGISSHNEPGSSSQPNSPHFASRWIKGLFGKSPRLEDRDDGIYSHEGQWMRQGTSPNQAMMQQNSNAWSDGLPLAGSGQPNPDRRHTVGNETFDSVEAEAMARKKHSMLMAARIEDEHRNRLMSADWHGNERVPSSVSPNAQKPWTSRQVIGNAPFTQEPEDWDPPQAKSPPGRKPAPRFTASDLEAMSQSEREQVASEIDPEDTLSKLEGRLTPAQQIIAETRSKMLAREEIELHDKPSSSIEKGKQTLTTQVQRGFDTNRRSSNGGERPPTLPSKSPHGSQVKISAAVVVSQPKEKPKEKQPVKLAETKTSVRGSVNVSTSGLTAGQGPMPKDMPLGNALQEMMVRFYRFERYAVPLMRSLEGRLVDVERDNQMALNGDGMSANSARDREMDKWVGQMTQLMRHEVGQLQAATRELREARELLAGVAKSQGVPNTSAAPTNNESSEKVKSMTQDEESRRANNISSLSFKSAVRKPEGSNNGTAIAPVATTNANISPNGRPRYTHALGRPMHDGKISPLVSPRKEIESAPSPAPSEQSSISRRAMSVDERLKALVDQKVRSPSITTQDAQSSIRSAMSLHGRGGNLGSGDGSLSEDTSFENISLPKRTPSVKIGDDYQFVMARGSSEASAVSAGGQSTTDSADEKMLKRSQTSKSEKSTTFGTKQSKHLQTPSNFSTQTDTTIKPTINYQIDNQRNTSLSVKTRTLSTPSSPGRMPLSPNLTGNSLRLATPTRQGSSSPGSMVPNESSSAIKTATHASKGLRARAQSYLQNAEQPLSGAGSGASSANISASNSSSWNQISSSSSPQVQALKSSSSTSILKDRNLNNLDGNGKGSLHFPSSSSDEIVEIRPLNVKKSTHSIKSSGQRSDRAESSEEKSAGTLIAGNFDTIKGSSMKSGLSASNSAVSSPTKLSIKDRVAFFDAQRN